MNIDELLTPVAVSQPENIYLLPTSYPEGQIERFPVLASEQGINPQFQKFYDQVVEGICGLNSHKLYEISDMILPEDEFTEMFDEILKPDLKKMVARDKKYRGIDIELNYDRLNDYIHNVVLGFSVSGYTIEKNESKMFKNRIRIFSKYTELLFTYKDKEFKLISKFIPFQSFNFDE